MFNVQKICTNTFNHTIRSAKEMAPVCKFFLPCVFGGVLCAGLKQKAETVTHEALIYATSNALVGAQWLLTFAAAASIFMYYKTKTASSTSIESRKIVHHIMTKEEFEAMKAEIARLKQELDETNKKFNPNFVDPKTSIAHKAKNK